jgi:hypothetical protein
VVSDQDICCIRYFSHSYAISAQNPTPLCGSRPRLASNEAGTRRSLVHHAPYISYGETHILRHSDLASTSWRPSTFPFNHYRGKDLNIPNNFNSGWQRFLQKAGSEYYISAKRYDQDIPEFTVDTSNNLCTQWSPLFN